MSRGEYSRLPMWNRAGSHQLFSLQSLLRPRFILSVLKVLVPLIVTGVLLGLWIWEPHIELAFYERQWIQKEIVPVGELGGCFDEGRVSERYNVSRNVYGMKSNEVQAGVSLRLGMDCYDFAGTVQSRQHPLSSSSLSLDSELSSMAEVTHYHSYWRTDLAPFGERQAYMLKSFFATQPLERSKLVLWSNGPLSPPEKPNGILESFMERYPGSLELRVADVHELAKGTVLEGNELLNSKDKKAWTDGDLIRLLVVWKDGGFWIDMDSLLTRDLTPLLEHEFVTQWDCYDKIYSPFNGALLHFHAHSPYLCEAFHIIATSPPPRESSTDWGSLLYLKLWRRLVHASIPPFKILPFCFSDGRSCRLDNRLPDPFVPDPSNGKWTMGFGREEGGGLDKVLGKVFMVHLHNQWEKEFPVGGWVRRLLLGRHEDRLKGHVAAIEDRVSVEEL